MTKILVSRATVSISLDGSERQTGHFSLPWSRNASGWGSLNVPLALITSGRPGPTVLLTGGNHGDEFEGPIVLNDLIRSLDASKVSGRIFVVPALNYPAFKAETRLSPIDNGNMNRAFLMRREGTMTEQIAHFVESELVERADAVLDFHAGGKTMMFHPFAVSHELPDDTQTQRAQQALEAFGAPVGLILEELDSEGMLDTAVEKRGKLFISTELGGGGCSTVETIRIARRGLYNFLKYVGVLEGAIEKGRSATRLMTNNVDGFISCQTPGLIEYLVNLGDKLEAGTAIAKIYDFERLDAAPTIITAPVEGMLLGRHHGGLAKHGDFLALIAKDL